LLRRQHIDEQAPLSEGEEDIFATLKRRRDAPKQPQPPQPLPEPESGKVSSKKSKSSSKKSKKHKKSKSKHRKDKKKKEKRSKSSKQKDEKPAQFDLIEQAQKDLGVSISDEESCSEEESIIQSSSSISPQKPLELPARIVLPDMSEKIRSLAGIPPTMPF
jgi:hypothetical protein